MPTRLIREGILTSKRVNALTLGAEMLYRKILNIADDYGRFEADPMLLLAKCYPGRLNEIRQEMIEPWLGECCAQGLLRLYEVDDAVYGEVAKFNQQIRSKKSRFPAPDEGNWLAAAGHLQSTCIAGAKQMLTKSETKSETKSKAKANPKAETETESTSVSAASPGFRKNKQSAKSRAGTAAQSRPEPPAGAGPPSEGVKRKQAAAASNGHSAEELALFRLAVQRELGPEATEAEVERKFREFIAPRRSV